MSKSVENSLASVTTKLEETIRGRLVVSAFQPIVDLRSGEIAGYEVLTRPTEGSQFSNAEEMFSSAEGHPLAWDLESLAREVALEAADDWPEETLLFLNSSPEIISDPRFPRQIGTELRKCCGLPPTRIVLEITERCRDGEFQGLARSVDTLRGAGFQIAIDDVGAGTSGLNRIMILRPGWLKLDRELVDGIDQDKVRQHLIRFLVYFGRLSAIRVLAEGIERIEELNTLIDLGVSFGQGYILARPGSRSQRISKELVSHIRQRACLTSPTGGAADHSVPHAGALARPSICVEGSSPVGTVAAAILQRMRQPGVAVIDGRRFIGWCDRETLLRAASDGRSALPMSLLVGSNRSAIDASMPLVEALEFASARDDHSLASPIVVTEGQDIVGYITMPDLLKASASFCRTAQFRQATLTGLPGRGNTELHLRNLIESSYGGAALDVAFIDIKGFSEFSQEYGYELSDSLIQKLAELMKLVLFEDTEEYFLGHLGDDQFIATAKGGVIEPRLQAFVRQFESLEPVHGADQESSGCPGVRVMLLKNVDSACRTSRDIFRARAEARRALDLGEGDRKSDVSEILSRDAEDLLRKFTPLRRSA